MFLYPAIDVKDGQCVRLLKGDINTATVFGDDPGAQAKKFVDAGCERLHVVDLNGAFEGKTVNSAAISKILTSVSVPVQLGGGIRSQQNIDHWIERGISRVILGTKAVDDPNFVVEACRRHPNKIVLGVDARKDTVAVEGWVGASNVNPIQLAKRFEDVGVAAIVYTDIDRDGTMQGPNIDATVALVESVAIPVIASGGVSNMDDLKELRTAIPNLEGVICGRAMYGGHIDVGSAVRLLGR